jgi:integrase
MSDSQICVTETKNLAAEQTQKTTEVPRKTDLKSAIVNFLWHLKKANYSPDTIRAYRFNIQQLVRLGVDLYNPETFIETMANQTKLTQTRKYSLRKAYKSFLNANKIEAELPTFKITRPLPYIPPEEYLDQLIASSNTQMTTFLETLKQIGARPGEVWRLKWEDIDIAGKKSASANQKKAATQESAPSTPNS